MHTVRGGRRRWKRNDEGRFLDIDHSRAFIGIFKINVVVVQFVDRMEHFPTIPISIAMITMNNLVFVPMVMSKYPRNSLLSFKSLVYIAVNYYIEMPMIRKNVFIYVITKPVYVHMKQMVKVIV